LKKLLNDFLKDKYNIERKIETNWPNQNTPNGVISDIVMQPQWRDLMIKQDLQKKGVKFRKVDP
jgi:hypothetical protein